MRYCWSIGALLVVGLAVSSAQAATGLMDVHAPVVGDIDGDGVPEIVAAIHGQDPQSSYNQTSTLIYAWRQDGTVMKGWPVVIPNYRGYPQVSPIVLADVDRLPGLEVIFAYSIPTVYLSSQAIRIYDKNATLVRAVGPNIVTDGGLQMGTAPVVADLNNDGLKEIIAAGVISVFAWSDQGTIMPGWPIKLTDRYGETLPATPPGAGVLNPALSVADLDHDGRLELIASSRTKLYAWRLDGTDVPGWPVTSIHDANQPPVFVPIGPQTGTVGQVVHFSVLASDPDGPYPLQYTVSPPRPDIYYYFYGPYKGWMTFEWLPKEAGTYDFTFTASDGLATAQQTVRITVNAPSPIVTPKDTTPPTVTITGLRTSGSILVIKTELVGTAQDASGIAEVRVYVYDTGRSTYTVKNALATVTGSSWTLTVTPISQLTPGKTIYVIARAKDNAGNWSTWQLKTMTVPVSK